MNNYVNAEDAPQDWELFREYCRQDVATTAALIHRLQDFLPQAELDAPAWEADYLMARRGVRVDVDLAKAIADIAEPLAIKLGLECQALTGGIAPTQVKRLHEWLLAQGLALGGLGEIEINEVLREPLAPDVRRVLEIRQEAARAGWRKVHAVMASAGEDGRLRDQLRYAQTHTFRWAGSGVQLQNLPRPALKGYAIEAAIEVLKSDAEALPLLFQKPFTALSSLMRALLCAAPGHKLGVCDYSKIEVVVLAWLSGDVEMLDALERGEDLYRQLAAKIYSVPLDEVSTEQRHLGKAGILGGGYGAGWKAFKESCRKSGMQICDSDAKNVISTYRSAHAAVPAFWQSLESAALRATAMGGEHKAGELLSFYKEDAWLKCRLPSGRDLCWFEPRVARVQRFHGTSPELRFSAVGKNGKTMTRSTYGGKLCENVVSSTARDLLAEAMVRAEAKQLQPVFTVHDELVCEGRPGIGKALHEVMVQRPTWAASLPISAEWQELDRYGT